MAEITPGRTLELDAAYCAVVGGALIAARRPLARVLAARPAAVSGAGIGAVLWAAILLLLSRRSGAPETARAMAVVNGVAASALVVAASRQERRWARFLIGGTGLDVAGIAIGQAFASGRASEA